MGLKKYEIITVGSDKRVRALRSWAVGGRYVNIGDVGGIVYDEKTLSQDGACWLFRGNFGFPGARIGGDSIVDVGETTLSATGAPNVGILGSSVVVGSKLIFGSDQTDADAVVLTADDFEQGDYTFAAGAKAENQKVNTPLVVRTKSPIFMGGVSKTLKLDVPGYAVQAFGLDADLVMVSTTANTITGEGVTLTVPAAQYCLIRLRKDPLANTVPADATTAQIKFTGTYETKLVVVDSRVEINPATSAGTTTIKPGGTHTVASGAKYPDSVIQNSRVVINAPSSRGVRFMSDLSNVSATIDATTADAQSVGTYRSVKNLRVSGVPLAHTDASAYGIIQATDCNDFAVSPTIFPGLAAARTANMPFIFQGCNVPNGIFYHHAQIANTYKNIDFAKAQADLGKSIPSTGYPLVSSEVEGMYRYCNTFAGVYGFMVESFDSVKSLGAIPFVAATYGTTIYKDAYLNGVFDFAGTNVFGNKVRSHPLAQVLNVAPRAVHGQVNATSTGQTITGVVPNEGRVTVPKPFRINSSRGLSLAGIPAGIDAVIFFTTFQSVITGLAASTGNTYAVPASKLPEYMAYVTFRKTDGSSLTVDEIAGVTVTVYNGCKIVNTGETAVSMKGNIRVEDNATLINCSLLGSGYFGGKAVMSGMAVNGYAYMKDNTLCTKTSENVQTFASLVMEGNAVYNSIASLALTGLKVFMYDKSKMLGDLRSATPVLIMRDNATIAAGGELSGASIGTVTIKDNAIVGSSISAIGDIVLCGDYVSTSIKTWTGKRVIDNHNAPAYDNNVKTQYDF